MMVVPSVALPVQRPAALHVMFVVDWPCTVSDVFPDGIVSVTWVDQLQLPEGMLTVVVEEVTELKAFCTSAAEQLAALIV